MFILASKIDSSKMFHEYSARQKYYIMNLQFVICYSLWYLCNLNSLKISLSIDKNFVLDTLLCPLLSNFILSMQKIFSTDSLSNIFATKKKLYKLSNYHSSIKIYYYRRFHLFPWNYSKFDPTNLDHRPNDGRNDFR